jgi:hypothetical protein
MGEHQQKNSLYVSFFARNYEKNGLMFFDVHVVATYGSYYRRV